jgi:small subunit ribosomal protein S17
MANEQRVNRKARVGTVVSDVNDQTIVVLVERAARHRLYKKVIRQTKKYHVHDPENTATVGDIVRIEEGRPVSKKKRWHLLEVLTERAVAEVAPEELDEELVDEVQRSASRAAAEEAEAAGETAAGAGGEATMPDAEPASETTEDAPAAEAAAADTDESEADESGSEADDEASEEERAE